MNIPIDRDKRIELLKWLKQGYIDADTLNGWFDLKGRTDEELEAEMRRLMKSCYPNDCHRLKQIGCCVDCNRRHGTVVNGVVLPKDSEEIPARYLDLVKP